METRLSTLPAAHPLNRYRALVLALVACALVLSSARPASAQWYVAGTLGANHTLPATVSISQPGRNTALDFQDVSFSAHPFESPQYYSVRGGRLFGERRRWGVELEWVHPKVYADVSRQVHVTGHNGGTPVDATVPMDTYVGRYSMSHGMNFVLFNIVGRVPFSEAPSHPWSRVALIVRAGAGPLLPHGETLVNGQFVEQYEWAGLGTQVAAGLDVRLAGPVSAIVDYRFSHARPEITIASGTGQTTANANQVTFGLAIGLTR